MVVLDLLQGADGEDLRSFAGGEEDDRRVEQLVDLERVRVLERREGAAEGQVPFDQLPHLRVAGVRPGDLKAAHGR